MVEGMPWEVTRWVVMRWVVTPAAAADVTLPAGAVRWWLRYGGNCNGYYGNYGYNNGCGYDPAGAIAGGLIGGAMNSFGAY